MRRWEAGFLLIPAVQSVHPFGLCFHDSAGWEPFGYARITRQSVPRLLRKEILYHTYEGSGYEVKKYSFSIGRH